MSSSTSQRSRRTSQGSSRRVGRRAARIEAAHRPAHPIHHTTEPRAGALLLLVTAACLLLPPLVRGSDESQPSPVRVPNIFPVPAMPPVKAPNPTLPNPMAPNREGVAVESATEVPSSPGEARDEPGVRGKPPGSPRPRAGVPLELRTVENAFNARIGSQTALGLGRYDGLLASQALGAAARLNLVGGFPLTASNTSRFDLDRSFYSLSVDVLPNDGGLTGRIFGVQQQVGTESERRSIGGQFGVDYTNGFGLIAVDYDVEFGDLGALSLLATTRLGSGTSLQAAFDARRYAGVQPVFSIVEGGSVSTVGQLLERLSEREIRAPLFDPQAQTRTFRLGGSRQITPELELSAGFTFEDVVSAELSSARANTSGQEQLDYSLAATWRNFLVAKSATMASLRIADSSDSRRYSGMLGGQYPLIGNLRFGPDLALEFREARAEWTYKPSLRFEYLRSRLRLDFRLGLEVRDSGVPREALSAGSLFYRIGYRYDF